MPEPWIEQFVQILNSGRIINNRMSDAIALKNDHLQGKVYKYRCVNDRSLQNLQEDTIWLASPDKYNDPFDCLFSVSDEDILPILRQTLNEELIRIYSPSAPELEPAHADRLLGEALEGIRKMRGATKICSFSAANNIILMWSHYANHHTGFCIEYDLEPLEPQHTMRKNLYPVIYDPNLYSLTPYMQDLCRTDRSAFAVNGLLFPVLYKYAGWSYEKEWRAIWFCDQICDDHAHAVPKASRVYLGAKIDAPAARQVYDICAARGIEVLKMKMELDRFRLEPEPYSAGR